MSIISPVNASLPRHFNSATISNHEILTSFGNPEDQIGLSPTVSRNKVNNISAGSPLVTGPLILMTTS